MSINYDPWFGVAAKQDEESRLVKRGKVREAIERVNAQKREVPETIESAPQPTGDVAQLGPTAEAYPQVDGTPNTRYGQGAPVEGVEAAMGTIADYEKEAPVDLSPPPLQPVDGQPGGGIGGGGFGGGGGGGGGLGISSTQITGPDYSGMIANLQAQAQNRVNQRDELAGIQARQDAMRQKDADYFGQMAQGYQDELNGIKDAYGRMKIETEEATKRHRRMLDDGIDPYGTKTAGVGRMNAGILAAAAAFRGEDPSKQFKFYDDLIDKDIRQQRGLIDLQGEKVDSLLSDFQRITGDKKLAEDMYRASKLDEMAAQARVLAGQTANAETKANLNSQALQLGYKAEELKVRADKETQALALRSMGSGLGGGGGGGAGGFDSPKFKGTDTQVKWNKMLGGLSDLTSQFDKIEELGDLGEISRLLRRASPEGFVNFRDDMFAILGNDRAIRLSNLRAATAQLSSIILNSLSGAAISPQEAIRINKFLPQLWQNPANFKQNLQRIKADLAAARDVWMRKGMPERLAIAELWERTQNSRRGPAGKPVK